MRVELAYGRGRLPVEVPNHAELIEPLYTPGAVEPGQTVRHALTHAIGCPPLVEILEPTDRVTIVHCDGTRPMPNALILQALGEVFSAVGIPDAQVTLLNALGTHRENTREELAEIVGAEALGRYGCLQSRSTDQASMRMVGQLKEGTPVELHHAYTEADVRLTLGFIEPHFFAGYSGGPKLLVPGIASQATVQHVHGAALVRSPKATWGVLDGNPLWESLYEAATLLPPTFIVNVALNRDKELTAAFAGEMRSAHRAGVAYVKEKAMREVEAPFDIVLTTNSGFPLDQNLYQSVKGMSAAARIVKPGGAIVMAAACSDGIPSHGAFREIVQEGQTAKAVLQLVQQQGFSRPDQWQAQVLAMVRQKARVFFYSEGILPHQARSMLLEPIADISTTVKELAEQVQKETGRPARICVLPEGPQTIPYLRTE